LSSRRVPSWLVRGLAINVGVRGDRFWVMLSMSLWVLEADQRQRINLAFGLFMAARAVMGARGSGSVSASRVGQVWIRCNA
jgi:hypothetical protein